MSEENKQNQSGSNEQKKTPPATPEAANIIWVGKRSKVNKETGKREMVDIPAPAFVIDGGKKFILPDGIENGVYMKDADQVKALFPNDFKTPVEKGKN